jgi:hypothetical protein
MESIDPKPPGEPPESPSPETSLVGATDAEEERSQPPDELKAPSSELEDKLATTPPPQLSDFVGMTRLEEDRSKTPDEEPTTSEGDKSGKTPAKSGLFMSVTEPYSMEWSEGPAPETG